MPGLFLWRFCSQLSMHLKSVSFVLTESLKQLVYISHCPLVTSSSPFVICWLSYSLLLTFWSPLTMKFTDPALCDSVFVLAAFLFQALPCLSSLFPRLLLLTLPNSQKYECTTVPLAFLMSTAMSWQVTYIHLHFCCPTQRAGPHDRPSH